MKTCTGCKIEKPLSEFSKDKHNKDGLQYKCRDCHKSFKKYIDKKTKKKLKNTKKKIKKKLKNK